jgi:predicted NAD/FAD-dependent oxidoreductase
MSEVGQISGTGPRGVAPVVPLRVIGIRPGLLLEHGLRIAGRWASASRRQGTFDQGLRLEVAVEKPETMGKEIGIAY